MPRKPPPQGYEWHPIIPGLIRRIVPQTAAQALYPNLRSERRGVPEPKRNVTVAEAMYPNNPKLRGGR